jgi:hypothetical protein
VGKTNSVTVTGHSPDGPAITVTYASEAAWLRDSYDPEFIGDERAGWWLPKSNEGPAKAFEKALAEARAKKAATSRDVRQ